MADYFKSSQWRKLTEQDVPRIAEALGRIAKYMENAEVREQRKAKLEEKILLKQLKFETNRLNEQQTKTGSGNEEGV